VRDRLIFHDHFLVLKTLISFVFKTNIPPMLLASCLLVVGFVILIKGADFLVSGASTIAK
jgi:hypothetical protein